MARPIRWITFLLAACGLAIAIYATLTSAQPVPNLPLSRPPSVSPFDAGIAALGFVEPAGKDVAIVAPEQAIITIVHADVGDSVKAGDALFELDARLLAADLVRAQAAVAAARAELDRWRALPRAEDLPPLQAALARATAQREDSAEQLRLIESSAARGANNDRDVSTARFALASAQAEVDRARAELDRARAGGWQPDRAVLEAGIAQREAEVRSLQLRMERLIVRAPRDGVILRRSIEAGESASIDPARPAMILGDLRLLRVRAQIDEEDIALLDEALRGGALPGRALARTRGARVQDIALRLVRVEPYARPKQDIAGTNTERVDTRVVDVVFDVAEGERPVLVPGQAVDVYIEATQ